MTADSEDPAQRARLADHWTRQALAEHASVASFARFALHLMAVGAPPDLLVATHQAGLDEIEHARL
ncbi:MAG: ferritin-like domain-containing protein, partial [Myxococcales bacterium]|nr:ferritin-like domain-containing protein [Myxococcales bacterium]